MLSSSWRHIVIVVAGSLAYLNSLVNPFVLDDEGTVLENEQIRTLWSAGVLAPERELPVAGRPVVNVTFALNYAIGGLDVVGYHLVNIGIHVMCALLLFGVARLLLQRVRGERPLVRGSTEVAFAVALIWLVHPLNSEAVDYLTQRTESLMAAFYLLTLYASLRALDSRRPVAWYVVAALSCALGMASKESMVTAPIMVILVDRVFLHGSFAQAFRAGWRFYAALASTWLVLGALLWTGPRPQSAGFGAGVSAWTYLLNQAPLITRYLRLTAWPTSLVANYGWPVPTTLADVFPSVVFVASLVGLTVAALWRQPKLGFLGAWFFIALAPTSSFVPIATEVGAERRMYLPVMAVIALAVLLAVRILRARVVHAILLVVVAALLARQTLAPNREYSSGLQLAQVTLGYKTAIVSSQNERWGGMVNFHRPENLDRFFHAETFAGPTYTPWEDIGFAEWVKQTGSAGSVDDRYTVGEAIQWIDSLNGEPFFLHMNLQSSHLPYVVPPDFPTRFGPRTLDFTIMWGKFPTDRIETVKDRYADSLFYVDTQVARLFEHVRRKGLWDDTVIVIGGDNGEAFYEHGFAAHASWLFDEVVKVPMIVRAPGLQAGVDDRPAMFLDVPPSIVDLLGLPPHPSFQGISLFDPRPNPDRSIFIVAQTPSAYETAIVRSRFKLHWAEREDRYFLNDLVADPGETTDVGPSRPALVEELSRRLHQWREEQLAYYADVARQRREYPPVFED